MALTVWDQALGVSREASQQDIDILQCKVTHIGAILMDLSKARERMTMDVRAIQQRYRTSEELSG